MRFHKHLLGMAAVVAGLVGSTFAGTLTNVSITGSDTNPGATGDYTFTYTVENTVPNADWAFCISTNPWDDSLGLFQHTISLAVDGSPVGTDNSLVHGLLGPNGSLCLSINTDVNSGSAVSATIEDLVNPGTGSHQIYLFTYNGSIVDILSGDYYDLQIGPIEVSSCDDLAAVNNDLSNDYVLTQDLDCSGSGNSIMIGADGNPFVGNFDGQGHIITVDINSTENYIGVFRSVNGATISDLTLSGSVISTHEGGFMMDDGKIGGLAGYTVNTTIDNVHSSAYVEGTNSEIGGLIGNAFATTVNDSSVSASVLGSGNFASSVGGLIGRAQNNTVISRSYSVGGVEGSATRVGGLAGIITDSTIQTSYAAGDIVAQGGVGGLIGWSFSTNITNAYARGNVTADGGWVGGLIAFVDNTNITNSYAAGAVTGDSDVGGLVGRSQGGGNVATESFWDTDATGIPTSLFGQSKTTIEMTDMNMFTDAGWDFDTIWGISGALNHGYPYLLAMPPLPDDTTAPDTFITFAGGNAVDSPNATFEFISNEDMVTFECSIDDGVTIEDFVPCTSPYTRTGFVYGDHIFYVRAVDAADNIDISPASRTWTIAESEEIVSVTPADGATNVATNTNIVVIFAQPVLLDITIASGPCDGSGSMCPVLDGVWSSGNTVLTYTRIDENFHNNTNYSIQITENNGIHWHQLYSGAFTIIAASQGGGGGGGGGSAEKDYCPNGDDSGNRYDNTCEEDYTNDDNKDAVGTYNQIGSTNNNNGGSTRNSCPDQEYQTAYLFSVQYSITTMPTCIDANMDGLLIRSHAAKMMSNYAINVLGKTPDNNKACDFSDVADQSEEMQKYMETACKLGLMGLETDGITPSTAFNPNDYLDKAQFATILSRLLYGEANNGNTTCWYCDHVAALQDAGVITVTTDLFDPLKRAFAMIMLMRTQKKNTYTNVDNSSRIDLDK